MADVPTLSITLLGAGQEVGRSCCVLQYRDITIVLDAGVHPAHTGMASLPFIDELDWSTVDAILITQCASFHVLSREQSLQHSFSFHLDHAAALTYITEKVREGLHSTISAQLLVRLDKFQRGKRQNLHDSSNESASQVYDAGLRSDEVCCRRMSFFMVTYVVVSSNSLTDALISPLDLSMSIYSIIPVSVHQLSLPALV